MEGNGTVTVTGYGLLGGSLVYAAVGVSFVIWFHCRRACPPIKARFWWQSEFIALCMLAWGLSTCLANALPTNEKLFSTLAYPIFLTGIFALKIRLANIYSSYKVAALYTEWKSSQNTLDINAKIQRGGIFVKYGRYIQSRRLQAKVLVVHAAFQLGLSLGLANVDANSRGRAQNVLLAFVLLCYCVPILYLSARTIPLKDGLYLRHELYYICGSAVWGLGSYIGMRVLGVDAVSISMFRSISVPALWVAALIVYPLHKSYAWQRSANEVEFMPAHAHSFQSSFTQLEKATSRSRQPQTNEHPRGTGIRSKWRVEALEAVQNRKRGSAGLVKMSLKQVLTYPEGVSAFREFCTLELNHESILFFLDVRELCAANKRSEMSLTERLNKADKLHAKYIKPGAPLEINIGDALKNSFSSAGLGQTGEAELAKVDFKLLEISLKRSRDEIFKLMATDPFVRFLRDRLYRDFVKNIKPEQESNSLLEV